MRSWKTTLGGACAATGTLLWGVPVALAVIKVELPPKVLPTCIVVGIAMSAAGAFFNGLFGRDNDVPSSAVPAAADADTKIKRDTEFLKK